MADIKQAARWLSEGRDVVRGSADRLWWLTPWYPLRGTFTAFTVCGEKKQELNCADLLADDWEIVP
jgi:hypothetical protein